MSGGAQRRGGVLMLLENNPYPHDSRVRQEAEALVTAGIGVTVISPSKRNQPWRETIEGVRVYRFPAIYLMSGGTLAFIWEFGYSLAAMWVLSLVAWMREGFSVVHAHNPPDLLCLIGMWYKVFGKKYVFDHHDLSPEIWEVRSGKTTGLLYNMLCWFERMSCRISDRVIATNESYKRINQERNGVPAKDIVVVRNGPNLKRVKIVPPDAELAASGRPVVAYLGTIGPQEGVDYLLRAAHILKTEHGRSDIFYVLVGHGDAVPALKQLTAELGLEEQVRFTGRIPDAEMMATLCAAHVCVDPDPDNALNRHSTMIKIMEYMALAKPIVVFDLVEHRASAGEAAVYVEPNNERAYAMELEALLNDPERRERMGAAGLRRIHDSLAWDYSAEKLVKMYRELLAS